MMLRSPKTWTTVSPKPAALLVASNTEGSGGTSLGPVKKVAISTLLYAAETWVLYGKHIQLLERFHQSFLWSIMGIHWQEYVTNDEALERARLPNIETMLLHRHLCWVGHVSRINVTQSCGLWENSAKVGGTEMLHAGAKRTSWSDGWHRLVLITETHWRLH